MAGGDPEYILTVIFYCRDLVEEIGQYPEFAAECERLAGIINDSLEGVAPEKLAPKTYEALEWLSGRALALYAENPESRYLDRIHRRVESLRDMCREAMP